MVILQIETATSICSVALSVSGKTTHVAELNEPNAHAAKLTRLIEQVIKEASLTLADLDAIAVSKGPGSYTGLRIGVSTAKGLCYGLEIPLIAIDSLHSLAAGFLLETDLAANTMLYPMIDARRLEVYTAVFDRDLLLVQPTKAQIIDLNYFDALTPDVPLVLFGDGADKFKDMFAGKANIQVVSDFKQSAAFLSKPAYEAFLNSNFEDIAYFEPFYLKDFVPMKSKKNKEGV
jgi:tRNA threonylcarbamoyladenosine biosynthesis protein TsaB